MIRVLIVDDSASASQMLSHILSSTQEISVLGVASNGKEAVTMAARLKPDVITMDIFMPGLNGFEATRQIMENNPVPIIIVSSILEPQAMALSFKTLEAGALSIIKKPVGIGHPLHAKEARELINNVKTLSQVKVVTRRPKQVQAGQINAKAESENEAGKITMIAMGSSTGGPAALQSILAGLLPNEIAAPIAIVQHISKGFIDSFASWLADTTGFDVCIAKNGEKCFPGKVYLAPDNIHMGFDHSKRIVLNNDPPDGQHKPSVAHLFKSTAKVFGKNAVGVILTGMGKDGAEELKMMRDAGAVTIAQDKESSVVFGMNGEAVKLNAAKYVLPPEDIVKLLLNLMAHDKSRA